MISANQLNTWYRAICKQLLKLSPLELRNYSHLLLNSSYLHSGLKKKTRETWITNELASILHKLDRDAEGCPEEREWKRIQMEKEKER